MTLLLMAGTAEARALAHLLAEAGIPAIASLAGATARPNPLPVPTRIGGYGSEEGQREWMKNNRIRAIVDATHPFAARITARTHRLAGELGLPWLRLGRPPWRPGPGDRWVEVEDLHAAAGHIPIGARVFLATGKGLQGDLDALSGRDLICRQIDPPAAAAGAPLCEVIVARPPFTLESEIALLRERRIDWLVARNAGGAASWPKLAAARALGLPVALLHRPSEPEGPRAETPQEALAWARAHSRGTR